jgi:hypothetical protein
MHPNIQKCWLLKFYVSNAHRSRTFRRDNDVDWKLERPFVLTLDTTIIIHSRILVTATVQSIVLIHNSYSA